MPADLLLVAALLRRGRELDRLSIALSLIAIMFGMAPLVGWPLAPGGVLLCLALLLSGIAQKYWALRVALDAELFERLGRDNSLLSTNTARLDQGLQALGLQKTSTNSRDWLSRSQGALRLLKCQGLCLLLQLLLILGALLYAFCSTTG